VPFAFVPTFQVGGPPAIARGALIEIASRLRTRTLRDASSANNPPPTAPFDGPPVDILPSREFTLYDRSANNAPYGRPAIDPPYGRSTNNPPYGRPVVDPPYGTSTNNPPHGRPAIEPLYGRPAIDPLYGRPVNDSSYERSSSNIQYGRLNESAPRGSSNAYPVDYFSKREYPSGSPLFVSNAPSSAYQRYAAPARLPTRDPSSSSLGLDYMSHHSYRGHVLTDGYSSKGTQQLGITRDGRSNAYDYTEVHL
jgi:poly(rC)-binding protein 3/4